MQDLRFAFRIVRKNPWFSAAIVLTLAFGIGVNTTVFNLVNAVLQKPLPFPGGDRLLTVVSNHIPSGRPNGATSHPDFLDLRASQQSFDFFEAFAPDGGAISEKGNPPERYSMARITSGMFSMLRVNPVLGRTFLPADETAGADPVLLLSYGVWKDRYGLDPSVIGRSVRVNEKPATIVGVMPDGFLFPANEKLWMPLTPTGDYLKRDFRRLMIIALRKPSRSLAEAAADLQFTASRLAQTYPDTNKDYGVVVRTFHQTFNGGPIRLVFLLMLGAVAFVLLIACANVANMLLSRAVGRSREMSIRTALGASRWRLVRQLLLESLLLSVTGGLLGLCLSLWGSHLFSKAVSDVGKPYWVDFSLDLTVLAYFAFICLFSALLFGLAPALHAARVNLNNALQEGSRGSSGGPRSAFLSSSLIVLQFTLAVILLTGAGLMIRSFLAHQDLFHDIPSSELLTARIVLPRDKYEKPDQRRQFFHSFLTRAQSLPGVRSAAIVDSVPGNGSFGSRFELEGAVQPDPLKRPSLLRVIASPGYFHTLGRPILQGRDFSLTDGDSGKESAIVTRSFASRFLNPNPIGMRFRLNAANTPGPWLTVVGVVGDLHQNLTGTGAGDPVVFVPYRQESSSGMAILLRTTVPPTQLAATLRREAQSLDEDLPLFGVEPFTASLARSRWQLSVFGAVFSILAVIALVMAAVGIYAVVAHATIRRTREIGVRMALGAASTDVLALILRKGALQIALAMAIGLAASYAVTRLMGTLIIVSASDPLTFAAVPLILGASGLLACYLPARRAASLDPVRALHHE